MSCPRKFVGQAPWNQIALPSLQYADDANVINTAREQNTHTYPGAELDGKSEEVMSLDQFLQG
jgi:hypothetical protein